MKTKRKQAKKIIGFGLALLLMLMPLTAFAEGEDDSDKTLKYYFSDVVNTGKDNGYSKKNQIKKKDPHYGWKLGEFYVSGYTSIKDESTDNPVFLKTVGDTVALWFTLEEDIDNLHPDDEGNSSLSINKDKNGYDLDFGTEKTNFGRGALIVKYTNSENKDDEPVIYTDYLSALTKGADTKVELFEEGDYEVALDYEIKDNPRKIGPVSIVPTYTNYRIYFKFSVRNGNCMVYPFDVSTGEELTNTSITENGFYLDLAKSKYLDINIKKEVLKDGASGLTEDTRFNRPAKDGDEYTEEGIYTITVKNKYTEQETTKVIYVGTNDVLKAYVTTGLPIDEIQKLVADGATIESDGTIKTASAGIVEAVDKDTEESDADTAAVQSDEEDTLLNQMSENPENTSNSVADMITPVAVIAVVVVFVVVIAVARKKRTNHSDKKEEDED